jgi:uncharacterized protein (DUF983 family)
LASVTVGSMRLKSQLQRWRSADVIDDATAGRIEAYEASRHGFRFSTAMFGLGALAMVLGAVAIVASNWNAIPASAKLLAHAVLNAGLAVGVLKAINANRPTAREILLFLLAGATLTFIALIGQIYQTGAPLWQALALWLLITSPFLFYLARSKITVACWILSFWATLGTAAETIEHRLGPLNLDVAFYALVPFVMIGVGLWVALRARWPVWPALIAMGGYVLITLAVSAAQIAWIDGNGLGLEKHSAQLNVAFLATLAAAIALVALRRARILEPALLEASLFPLISVPVGFAPLLIRHGEWPVIGAGVFMAYWALVGWTGLQAGYRSLLNLAIIVIALRLVIVYVELFGGLLATGVGLIVSGGLLIGVVWATGKLIRRLGRTA